MLTVVYLMTGLGYQSNYCSGAILTQNYRAFLPVDTVARVTDKQSYIVENKNS